MVLKEGYLFENPKCKIKISSFGFTTGSYFGEKGSVNFITGFCVGDWCDIAKVNFEKFDVKDKFCLEQFYEDFPYVGNLSSLVIELEKRGIEVNIEELIKNSYK